MDRWHVGTATRLNPEAPVPVVNIAETFEQPGGAGNVARNLQALGAEVLSLIPAAPLPVKNRLMVGTYQLARWDEHDQCAALRPEQVRALAAKVTKLVVADYGKGSITPEVLEVLQQLELPIFVDTKRNPLWYHFATAVFPNLKEYEAHQDSYSRFERCVVTCGAGGLRVLEFGREVAAVPAYAPQAVSVCGAGDTVTAAYAYAWPAPKAAEFASLAAAIAVSKPYTSTATLEEVESLRRSVWRRNEKKGGRNG